MEILNRLHRALLFNLVRRYTLRELPGWGKLMQLTAGPQFDRLWPGLEPVWCKGKLHGYWMHLSLEYWPSRACYFLGRYYERSTQALFEAVLSPGDVMVDIGANEGMLSLLASRLVGDRGKVIAFEPNPVPRATFELNITRNAISNIDLRPVGLSDRPAILRLFAPTRNSGEGSFALPSNIAEQEGTLTECSICVGDDELSHVDPAVIKIDVEGFEERVLRGLSHTISRSKPVIVVEAVEEHLARAGSSRRQLAGLLTQYGYKGFEPVDLKKRTDKLTLVPVDFDRTHTATDWVWWHPQSPSGARLHHFARQ